MIAFVGAGGKTTAAWRVLNELVEGDRRAVFTTTTMVFKPRSGCDLLLDPSPASAPVDRALADGARLVLAAGLGERGDPHQAATAPYPAEPVKLLGLAPAVVDRLSRELPGVTWLVEADGARGRLLKAPAAHEPVIPSEADRVVIVAALDAVGRHLDETAVHRPEIVATLLGVEMGVPIAPGMIADVVAHPLGGLKGIPAAAECVVLLTHWGGAGAGVGAEIADRLSRREGIGRIVEADVRRRHPVTSVWAN